MFTMKLHDQVNVSESHSFVSDSLRSHRLYSPWNSPGQNTGVGNFSLLQGIFPTQRSNPGLSHCRLPAEPPGKSNINVSTVSKAAVCNVQG